MSNLFSYLSELNKNSFFYLNKSFNQGYFDHIAILADKIGGPHIFHYHLTFIFCVATILFFHRRNSKIKIKELLILGATSSFTLFFSILINLVLIVNSLKYLIAIERPFCSLDDIYVIKEVTKDLSCQRSFPSGHMSFTIIMVASFWKIFSKTFKFLAIISIIIIALSRIVSGAHYPIDILAAIVICLPITVFIESKTSKAVIYFENRWSLFERLCKKLSI